MFLLCTTKNTQHQTASVSIEFPSGGEEEGCLRKKYRAGALLVSDGKIKWLQYECTLRLQPFAKLMALAVDFHRIRKLVKITGNFNLLV